MKIVVCIKQVPDTTEIKLDPVKGTLIRDGVPSIMNPDDKGGLEEALKLKDKYGAHVTVITMGPPQAEAILREAYAMGVDRAILLTDRKFGGADTLATSNTIAAALRNIEADLIIAGRQAIDGDTAQVGPELAEHMGYPQVTCCLEAEARENELVVLQEGDNNKKVIGITYPCVVTFTKPDIDPRFPTFKRKIAARKTIIPHISSKDIEGLELLYVGIKGSPTKVRKSFVQLNRKKGIMIESKNIEKNIQELYDVIHRICENWR